MMPPLINHVNETFTTNDFEIVGIDVLFRGTTKNVEGSLYSGNLNSQIH